VYRIVFEGVTLHESRAIDLLNWKTYSSFDLLEGSPWPTSCGARPSGKNVYSFLAYDHAIRLLADGFTFEVVRERPR